MIDQTTPAGRIEVEPVHSILRNRYRFVAFNGVSERVLEGDPFSSNPYLFAEGDRERAALQRFIRHLEVFGWETVPAPGKWYAHRVYPSAQRAAMDRADEA